MGGDATLNVICTKSKLTEENPCDVLTLALHSHGEREHGEKKRERERERDREGGRERGRERERERERRERKQ